MNDAPDATDEPVPATAEAPPALPVTGHPQIDAALAELELDDDVHSHHDRLSAVLDVVQQALNPSSQPPLPRP